MLSRVVPKGWKGWLLTLIALPVLGMVLSIVGESIPDDMVTDALVEAIDAGLITEDNRTLSAFGTTVDHHSECIGLTTGLGDANRGIIEVAVVSPNLGNCEVAVEQLDAWRDGGELVRDWDYLRYWHGHTAFTRPIVAVFGVEAVRTVTMGLLLGSFLMFYIVLSRRSSRLAATLFMTPLVVGSDLLTTPQSGPHGVAAVVVIACAAVVLVAASSTDALPTIAIVSSLSAGLLVLVDVFTIGTMSWTLTTAMVGLGSWTLGRRGWQLLKPMTVGAAAWGVAYVSTWVAKWAIAGLFVGFDEVWRRISTQVGIRVSGDVDYIDLGLGNSTTTVLGTWWLSPLGPPLVAMVVIWMAMAAVKALRNGTITTWLALASPVLLAVVWFEVMQNHTQVHRWFTAARGVAVCSAVLLLASELTRSGGRGVPDHSDISEIQSVG